MAGKRWGENGSVGDAPAGLSARLSDLLGRWFEASRAAFGWSFDAWYDAPVGAVARGLERGVVDRDALAALGASRFARGRTQDEVLADFECALRVADASMGTEAAEAARACVVAGFLNPAAGDPSWFGDARSLSRSLRRLYADTPSRRPPVASHTLLLIDINLSWLDGPERAMALAAAAEEIHEHFPAADPVACLGDPRFGVVVRRHPGLAVGAESLHLAFEAVPLLAGATKVLLVPLPESSAGVGPFVRELTGAQRPLNVRTYEPRTAAGGGPGAELLRAAVPISAVRPARRRRLISAIVMEGSGMLAAAVAALVLAVGVGRAVGPVSVAGQTPTTQLFGLAPPIPAPVPAPVAPDHSPPAPASVVEPVSEPEALATVALVTPKREPAPVASPPPPADVAEPVLPPAPAPVVDAPPVSVAAVSAAPEAAIAAEPTPASEPCAGLDEKDARKCQRQMQRTAEKQAEEQAEAQAVESGHDKGANDEKDDGDADKGD